MITFVANNAKQLIITVYEPVHGFVDTTIAVGKALKRGLCINIANTGVFGSGFYDVV